MGRFQINIKGEWKDYAHDEDKIVKMLYKQGGGVARILLRGQQYEYDFNAMEERNLSTRKVRAIRPPREWEGMAARPVKTLRLTILSATGLRSADWLDWIRGGRRSDPYCICELSGRCNAGVQTKTKVVHQTVNPVWNHEAELPDVGKGDALVFKVYDKDWGKRDDFLGMFTLQSEQFFHSGFSGKVRLTEAGKGIEAYLKLKIVVPEEALSAASTAAVRPSFAHEDLPPETALPGLTGGSTTLTTASAQWGATFPSQREEVEDEEEEQAVCAERLSGAAGSGPPACTEELRSGTIPRGPSGGDSALTIASALWGATFAPDKEPEEESFGKKRSPSKPPLPPSRTLTLGTLETAADSSEEVVHQVSLTAPAQAREATLGREDGLCERRLEVPVTTLPFSAPRPARVQPEALPEVPQTTLPIAGPRRAQPTPDADEEAHRPDPEMAPSEAQDLAQSIRSHEWLGTEATGPGARFQMASVPGRGISMPCLEDRLSSTKGRFKTSSLPCTWPSGVKEDSSSTAPHVASQTCRVAAGGA